MGILGDLQWIIGGAVALIAAFAGVWFKGKRTGKKEAEHDRLKDDAERQEKGREALRAGRDSGLTPDERLRRNDQMW